MIISIFNCISKRLCHRKTIIRLAALILLGCGSALFSGLAYSQSGSTLLEVKKRGKVRCGVSDGLPGFGQPNSLGDYTGLDADFCRAVSSAIFDDPNAVDFVPLTTTVRFDAIKDRRIDVLARNTTWTLSRNTAHGEYVGVNYYDGQGFMVTKRSGIQSALELDNQGVCVKRETTTALNAADYFAVSKMRYRPVYYDSNDDIVSAYEEGRCAAMTNDISALAALREELARPDSHAILPEVISKEPLGPMVPSGDREWTNLVRWTLNCMINAEEMGIDSSNVASFTRNPSPAAARLLGTIDDFGENMGVDNKWCANVIAHIGNYAESFERNIGENTPLGLARGVNKLWTDGGLLYAPPIR